MGLETFEYIDDLDTANPLGTDDQKEGDDHLRGIKATLKNTLSGADGKMLHISASSAPTTEDDSADGFVVGSLWVRRDTGQTFTCTDNSLGAAVWRELYRASGTDVPVADGGTGASTAAAARANLGAQPAGQVTGINAQTGTTYTLVAADRGKMVTCNNASPITVTTGSSAVHTANDVIHVLQLGAGQVTFAAGSGVTLTKSASFNAKTKDQYSMATIIFTSATQAYLVGMLEAA